MEQQPDFAPGNYANLTNVPVLFNQSASIIATAAPDVNNVEHEADYQHIVAALSHIHKRQSKHEDTKPADIDVTAQSTVSLEKDPLQKAVEDYFCDVIDSGQPKTALDYFEQHALEFDPEVWIYQVIGGYQALDEQDKQFFALEPHGKNDKVYTGNFYISDITLGLR